MAIFKDHQGIASDRSQWDRRRHRTLVEKAIKENLGGIIADESIIGQSGDKKIKIPVKGIKEYQFVYGRNNPQAGSGNGGEERGQKIGSGQPQFGNGQGGPGNEAGEDIYETEVTLEELTQALFQELELPDMEQKKFAKVESMSQFKRSGLQRKGIPPRLAKKQTMLEKLKRLQGKRRGGDNLEERQPFIEDDLRYHRVKEECRPHSNAVVICIMDTSGSMDQTRKYLARSFFFLLYRFVRYRYQTVQVVFIAHSTEAKEVSEDEFFHKGESGGTFISSGYVKALDIITQRYDPSIWNIYAFHCSDGDNWREDDDRAVAAAKALCEVCSLFGYGEIGEIGAWSAMRRRLSEEIQADNFGVVSIRDKSEVWPAFRNLLAKDRSGGDD